MLSTADWTAMQADFAELRGDNSATITIRRGNTTVAAQTVRLTRGGTSGRAVDGRQTQESRGRALVWGDTTFNVQAEDRFTVAGVLYRVVLVQPQRRARVVAEVEQVA